ncbi:predicted protein [Naegleria gruberi]|uniref:Predicted protein n=1 Tax=Naegleria gruberi TaxID=5762 RepID=D2V775_NAEGR|nr:uncharacterized protein NAEGRDRAFT_47217 [Naegleria gruberi]EFC47207.1 predicted protein [Naegleria gruberi]|eukprot:XP_002679951.1 predicted protein [Naegleria gruberi strain NEG-M]
MESGLSLNLVDFNSLVVSSTNSVGDSAVNTRRMLAKSWTSLLLGGDEGEDEVYSSSPPTIHHHLQNTHLNSDPNDLVVLHDFNDNSSIITDVISNVDNGSSNHVIDSAVIQKERLIKKQLECKKLRMLFSPPEMLTEDGEIEESYFRPDPSRIFNMDCLKTLTWNKTDEELLRRGINEFGNDWTAIILKYLPNWDAKELQEKCKQLKISTKKARTTPEPKINTSGKLSTSSSTKRKKKTKKKPESEDKEFEENETDEESFEIISEEEKKPKRKTSNKKNATTTVKSKTISKTNKKSNSKQNGKSTTKKVAVTNSETSEEEEEFNEDDFISEEEEEDEMSDEEPPKSSKRGGRARPKRQVQRYCYHENSSGEDEMLDQYID